MTGRGDAMVRWETRADSDPKPCPPALMLISAQPDRAVPPNVLEETPHPHGVAPLVLSSLRQGLACLRGEAPEMPSPPPPCLVLIDTDTIDLDPEPLRALIDARVGLVALMARSLTGWLVNLALQVGADSLVEAPLDGVTLCRLRSQLALNLAAPRGRTPPTPEVAETLQVVGESEAMRTTWQRLLLAAQTNASILIHGETGTGKEVMARVVHAFSARRHGPFVAFNCAAVPETLLESELFGHEKGAFTGATSRRIGRFELARGGTLLLDEIGDMPPALQVKLLRVLQERTFERLGSTEAVSADIRLIAATHRDLAELCRTQRFRLDLFYRLNVVDIHLPPLRERQGDIVRLWEHFLAQEAARERRPVPQTDLSAQKLLLRHDWPGNVRELQNVAQRALTISTKSCIEPSDLPLNIGEPSGKARVPSLLGLTAKETERLLILQTYAAFGTVKKTAQVLGLSPRTIHYRLKTYKDEGAVALPPPAAGPPAAPGTSMRILLAEDDDDLRWALASYLTSQGYDVSAVANGAAALAHIEACMRENNIPDIIVTDVRMPGITGTELLQSLRTRGCDTPVVIMSAFADEALRLRAKDLGANLFLEKPIEPAQLQSAVLQILH